MPDCDDLRLGGTLTGTGLTGGTSINSTALSVADWSGLFGSWGMSGQVQVVNGRWGGYVSGDLLGRERYPTLNMNMTSRAGSGIGPASTWQQQLWDNTDVFLGLLTDPAGNYLEVDLPDGTSRFLFVYNLDPAVINQPKRVRSMSAPLVSPWPYWKEGGNQETDTITTTDTMTVGGNREVWDAVLVFAGDGTFTHSDLGWSIEVVGSGGAVTVDLGNRTVTEGGNPAVNRIRRNSREWGWFVPGVNNVTSDVSVGVTWRSSWA